MVQVTNQHFSTPLFNTEKRAARFGNQGRFYNTEKYIAKNQIVNRTIIETLGYAFWAVLFARNGYERLERSLDWFAWTFVGAVALPVAGKMMVARGGKEMKKLGVTNTKALETPFEKLEHHALSNSKNRMALAKELGLKNVGHLKKVTDAILKNKLMIVGVNLLLLGAKGQIFYWGKNLMTEHFSGRKGFVGEFTIADAKYTDKKAQAEERSKKFRQIVSIAAGVTVVFAAPLWIYALTKSKAKSGLMGQVKKLLPLYNYQDAIYLSKAVLIFHNLFNWYLPSALSARDSHERREVLFKNTAFDFFYFIGDEIIASAVGRRLQNRYKKELAGYKVMTPGKNFLGISMTKHYSTIFKDVESKAAPPIALKLARVNFWSGILGTAACLGVATTLLNNWYTKKKVTEELAVQKQPQSQSKNLSNNLLLSNLQQMPAYTYQQAQNN